MPIAEEVTESVICLPIFADLTMDDQTIVIEALNKS